MTRSRPARGVTPSPTPPSVRAAIENSPPLGLTIRAGVCDLSALLIESRSAGCLKWVTGGKTRDEYMFPELLQIADTVRSAGSPKVLRRQGCQHDVIHTVDSATPLRRRLSGYAKKEPILSPKKSALGHAGTRYRDEVAVH